MSYTSKFTECFDFDSTQLGQQITFLDSSSKTSLSSSTNSQLFDTEYNIETRNAGYNSSESKFPENSHSGILFSVKVKHFLSALGKKQPEKLPRGSCHRRQMPHRFF